MRVLVTGGTGRLGRHVAGDLLTGRGLRAALAGVDAVLHLASNPRRPAEDVQAIRQLQDAADETNVGHLVFVSIIGVERIPYAYYEAKWAVERTIEAGRTPWTIVRVAQFHSFVDLLFAGLAVRYSLVVPVPAGWWVQSVAEAEVADRLIDVLREGPAGRLRDFAGPEILRVSEAARTWAWARRVRKKRSFRYRSPEPSPARSARARTPPRTRSAGRSRGGNGWGAHPPSPHPDRASCAARPADRSSSVPRRASKEPRMPRTHQFYRSWTSATLATALLLAGANAGDAQLTCDLSGYTRRPDATATISGNVLALEWAGAERERVSLRLQVRSGTPMVEELALLPDGSAEWVTVGRDLGFEFRIVEGLRRITNQQLAPLRQLGIELTPDVIDRYKWDAFWDAPLDLSTEVRGGNPPPAEGVANQPGLPRSPDEIRRAVATYRTTGCWVVTTGRRMRVTLPGMTLGSFTGSLVLSVHEGTNLIRVEAAATTPLPSVAYKYDVGLTGLDLTAGGRVYWRDIASQMQSYSLRGPVNADPVPVRAANRLVVAETGGGAIAAFPPPHTFFWAREIEVNVGNNWYRKDSPTQFSIGIRQGEQEVVEQYRANWSLYSAPQGTVQHMAAYFYPTLGDHTRAFDAALAFTNGDVYRPLDGYQVMGSHYHSDVGRSLMATGSMDSRLSDFEVLRSAGINIAGPVDRPRDATQLEEQLWLFEGAERHSDETFMVMPQMENSNLLGGHWDLLFSHPVHYVDARAEGTPLVTEHPEYGRVYNIGSVADMLQMIEAEDMLVFMPHPRTKGSTGYPDAIKDSPQFLTDRYRGVGWRWGMGSDLSEVRLSDKRVIPLLDDMNNWIARTSLRPKGLLAITETYSKQPGDDIYANGPVTYVRLDALPEPGNYAPIVDALERGDYFVTSGEVLIPSHRYEGTGANMRVVAEVEWTFPLAFVEVVYGDGETVGGRTMPTNDLLAFGRETFTIPFDGTGQAWVRFAAWDFAGNGAMTTPIRLGGR